MVPGGMPVTAEYRPERSRHGSQHRARTKSHPGVRTGRKGKRQNESTKDDNRPRAHDRSPAGCRINSQLPSFGKVPSLQPQNRATADCGALFTAPHAQPRQIRVTYDLSGIGVVNVNCDRRRASDPFCRWIRAHA